MYFLSTPIYITGLGISVGKSLYVVNISIWENQTYSTILKSKKCTFWSVPKICMIIKTMLGLGVAKKVLT